MRARRVPDLCSQGVRVLTASSDTCAHMGHPTRRQGEVGIGALHACAQATSRHPVDWDERGQRRSQHRNSTDPEVS